MSDIAAIAAEFERLREALAAQGQVHAAEPVAPQIVDEVVRRYNLPAGYRDLLLAIGRHGLSITPGPFQRLVLYAAPDLEAAQVGFRGPRLGDETFVAPHGWRRAWVVIAADAGDPYFLDVARASATGECPVYTAMHGTGTWEPLLAASSLEQFLGILTAWVRIVVPQYDPQNPEEPLDDVQARRLATEIERIDPAAAEHWTV